MFLLPTYLLQDIDCQLCKHRKNFDQFMIKTFLLRRQYYLGIVQVNINLQVVQLSYHLILRDKLYQLYKQS